MISARRVVHPHLRISFAQRNSSTGNLAAHFAAQGGTGRKEAELEATWLATKGGTGKGLNELWGSYLATKGYTTGNLGDRMRAFFATGNQS